MPNLQQTQEVDIIINRGNGLYGFDYIVPNESDDEDYVYKTYSLKQALNKRDITKAIQILGDENLTQYVTVHENFDEAIQETIEGLKGEPDIKDFDVHQALAYLDETHYEYVIYNDFQKA